MAELGCLKDGHFNNLEVQNFTLNSAVTTSLEGPLQAAALTSTTDVTVGRNIIAASDQNTDVLTAVSGAASIISVGGGTATVQTPNLEVGVNLTVAGTSTFNDHLLGPPADTVSLNVLRGVSAANSFLNLASLDATVLLPNLQVAKSMLVSIESLSGAGNVDIDSTVTGFTTESAADAVALAPGSHGQLKFLYTATLAAGGHTTVVTAHGGAIVTFDAATSNAILLYVTNAWVMIGGNATLT